MVELLAGALVGDVFSFEASARDNKDGGPPQGGELIIAIDPSRCVAGESRAGQLARAEELFARVLAQEGTRLPSDRRYAARLTTPTEGISIPASLFETLQELQTS
jgi:LDH2 family malate/lactate/ureidoglycolate dehydrogenase